MMKKINIKIPGWVIVIVVVILTTTFISASGRFNLPLSWFFTRSGTAADDGSPPSGVIVMWSGSYNDIPSGWQLCDGTNGSPDLRDKFVYGVNTSYGAGNDADLGATGGATTHSHTYSDLPKHSHTATISPNPHSHGYSHMKFIGYPPDTYYSHYASDENVNLLSYTTDATSLSVSLSETGSDSCSTDAASSLPPYYKLAFIMKL